MLVKNNRKKVFKKDNILGTYVIGSFQNVNKVVLIKN